MDTKRAFNISLQLLFEKLFAETNIYTATIEMSTDARVGLRVKCATLLFGFN
jgi:hypothetical protein